jgi:hypothetical protein
MYEWHSFLQAADEWFITYSLPPMLMKVKFFAIGHTVELYLKAANTKITGDIERAMKFGHNLKAIWDDCKAKDSAFMPKYEIRDDMYNRDLLLSPFEGLNKEDTIHLGNNYELYIIAKHLPDLKYLGAPLKTMKGTAGLYLLYPNHFWTFFLKDIRRYLGHPRKGTRDIISYHIDRSALPPKTVQYLRELYT